MAQEPINPYESPKVTDMHSAGPEKIELSHALFSDLQELQVKMAKIENTARETVKEQEEKDAGIRPKDGRQSNIAVYNHLAEGLKEAQLLIGQMLQGENAISAIHFLRNENGPSGKLQALPSVDEFVDKHKLELDDIIRQEESILQKRKGCNPIGWAAGLFLGSNNNGKGGRTS